MFNYCIDDVLDRFKKPKHKKDKKKKPDGKEKATNPISENVLEEVQEAIHDVEEVTKKIEKGHDVSEKKVDEVIAKSEVVASNIIRHNKKPYDGKQENNHKNSKFQKDQPKKKESKKNVEDDDYSIIIDIDV